MLFRSPAHLAQELFQLDTVVLAHDGADPGGDPGPRLIYANAAALRLWSGHSTVPVEVMRQALLERLP